MIYAVIEEYRYDTTKTNHAGNRDSWEVEKHYRIKFSGSVQNVRNLEYKFEEYCEKHNSFWRWDYLEEKMCEQSYIGPELHCYCQLMSNFLAENDFIPAFSSAILHYYYKT